MNEADQSLIGGYIHGIEQRALCAMKHLVQLTQTLTDDPCVVCVQVDTLLRQMLLASIRTRHRLTLPNAIQATPGPENTTAPHPNANALSGYLQAIEEQTTHTSIVLTSWLESGQIPNDEQVNAHTQRLTDVLFATMQIRDILNVPVPTDASLLPEAFPTTVGQIPSFYDLREKHHFSTALLAQQARVLPSVVYAMLRGWPVARTDAVQVLEALSLQTGEIYTLDRVTVAFVEEEPDDARRSDP